MIVITSAMPQETDAVLACLMGPAPAAGTCPAWRGDCSGTAAMALCTGIGREAVTAGLGGALAEGGAVAVVSAGFAGALTADLKAGDIILCDTTLADGETGRYGADGALLARAERAFSSNGPRVVRGTGVTVPVAAVNRRAKAALRERAGADICEMEDYWAARLAADHGLPFLAVRVVLDEMTTDISDFAGLVTGRGFRPWRALRYFIAHPGRLGAALRSFRQYRAARASLRHFIKRFLSTENGP